jgi:hypothetical protein
MQIDIQEFLKQAKVNEAFYPGKHLVWKCPQPGEYKSHSVVFDWSAPEQVNIEIKPGLTGRDLDKSELKHYPVSFQAPTYVEIDVARAGADNDNSEDDEGEEEQGSARGKQGKGGGKGQKKAGNKKDEAMEAFGRVVEGDVPSIGEIKNMVVMGKEIAKGAYAQTMEMLARQIAQARVLATDLMAEAGKNFTRYTPPEFMQPKGDETATYRYDRDKNSPMFGTVQP